MLSTVVALLFCAAGGVLSCEPCKCSVGDDGLQVAKCVNVTGLSSIPSTDTLPDYIQVLYIWDASIPIIKENQFDAFQKLEMISILVSQVSKVELHAFRNMKYVRVINLYRNLITELPAGLFSDTPGLVELFLHSNKLKVLPKNLFSNLKYLKYVNLAYNQIATIEANCFENVTRLETLHLYDNKLFTLTMNFIDDWSSLKRLWLYKNPWHCDESLCGVMAAVVSRELWKEAWANPTCATPQSLQGKEWSELEEHTLLQQCTPSKPWCRIEGPNAARCFTSLGSARLPDTLPNNITLLHVTDQQFTTLNNSIFSSYALLQELHLERNQIHNIEPNVFLATPNLIRVLLNENNLTRLNKFQFSNLAMLKEVDFSFNNISFIEKGCFVNVSSLRTINLSYNQLQTLQLNVMDSAMSLERLLLEGNPWRCDEALCGLLDAVVGRALWGPSGVIPTCAAPPPLARKPWPQLPQHFHPDILILDSNNNWTRVSRATNVLAASDVMLQCRYCFVSRVTWSLNSLKLPRNYQRTSQEALISTLTLENVHKLDEGAYVCHVSQCPDCDTAWLQLTVNLYIPDIRGLQQECGEVTSEGVTNIVNGTSTKKGEFPWHIALYRRVRHKYKYQCGGSIISPLIILTAAHCLTDEKALRYPDEQFYIAAGKYHRDYNSADDTFAQKRQVKEYHIPTEYRGYESNYAGDLAVVVVKRAFRMTNVVQPVCMDWNETTESEHLQHNQTGSVVGWGYVDPNNPKKSEELKRLDPPIIGKSECLDEVPANFRRWVTGDKFCAGFRTGASVCNGDSGGGMVLKWNNTHKYVIRGLVSVGPTRKGTCDDSQYGVYTRISHYKTFIQNVLNANRENN